MLKEPFCRVYYYNIGGLQEQKKKPVLTAEKPARRSAKKGERFSAAKRGKTEPKRSKRPRKNRGRR